MRHSLLYRVVPQISQFTIRQLAAFAVLGCVLVAPVGLAEDSATRLAESLEFLASDDLGGRGVGTAGIDAAANYISEQFTTFGLEVKTQEFKVATHAELGDLAKNRLVLSGPTQDDGDRPSIVLEVGKDYQPLAIGGSALVEAPIVFVGYGITSDEHDFDEYAGIDVKGKVVLILRKEPQQDNDDSVFAGKRSSRHAYFSTKISNALEHGAAAVILVNDRFGIDESTRDARKQWNESLDELVKKRSAFQSLDAPAADVTTQHYREAAELITRLTSLEERSTTDFDELLTLEGAGYESSHRGTPVVFARRALLNDVLETAGSESLNSIEAAIDDKLVPQSRPLEGWTALVETKVLHKTATVRNVVGILEGEGDLAHETVVVGAHYDHLGMGGPGSLAPWTNEIHNGADDNGSGTAALLEVARGFATNDKKPSRRIVFIAFAGEERGLLGSAHYVKNPLFPLETTVAMVNMDMVGRLTDNKLIVYGTGTATEFDGLIDELNKVYEFDITKETSGFGPSDHTTFYEKKIPVFHFFTGTHSDYHRPSDDVDKINFEGMERIVGLVSQVTNSIVDAKTKPEYLETRRGGRRRGGDKRPYLGIVPDFTKNDDGLAIEEVAKDSPANRAGVKVGDIIVRFGDNAIDSFDSLVATLGKYKAGDLVEVVVQRNGERLNLTVTLADPQ